MLTLDVARDNVLDLRGCGVDVRAVALDLAVAGIPVTKEAADEKHPHELLRRIPIEAFKDAGYRVVRVQESINGRVGDRHSESMLIVDLAVVIHREVLSLPAAALGRGGIVKAGDRPAVD